MLVNVCSKLFNSNILRRATGAKEGQVLLSTMSKQKGQKKAKSNPQSGVNQTPAEQTAITMDKSKNILIQIIAKPGAKQNSITDISEEGIGVQINAPATEGEANAELVKYLSSVIGIRKGDVSLERGFKSRQKTIKIIGGSITLEEIKQKLQQEIES